MGNSLAAMGDDGSDKKGPLDKCQTENTFTDQNINRQERIPPAWQERRLEGLALKRAQHILCQGQ
jgi:hypothetical protein